MISLWLLALAGNLCLWGLSSFFPDAKSFYAATGLWWYIALLHILSFLLRRKKTLPVTLLGIIPLAKLLLALGGTVLLLSFQIRSMPLILTLSAAYIVFGTTEVLLLLRNLRSSYAQNSPANPSQLSLE
ncbi:MAG: hypothetical protein ACUVRD_05675 [Bacteroidia bacterium]